MRLLGFALIASMAMLSFDGRSVLLENANYWGVGGWNGFDRPMGVTIYQPVPEPSSIEMIKLVSIPDAAYQPDFEFPVISRRSHSGLLEYRCGRCGRLGFSGKENKAYVSVTDVTFSTYFGLSGANEIQVFCRQYLCISHNILSGRTSKTFGGYGVFGEDVTISIEGKAINLQRLGIVGEPNPRPDGYSELIFAHIDGCQTYECRSYGKNHNDTSYYSINNNSKKSSFVYNLLSFVVGSFWVVIGLIFCGKSFDTMGEPGKLSSFHLVLGLILGCVGGLLAAFSFFI